MAGSRAPLRFRAVTLALARWGGARRRPDAPQRILVLHHLLLGDTLMVTALLAKLRERHPGAAIVMTVPGAIAPLYAGRPYGVDVVALDQHARRRKRHSRRSGQQMLGRDKPLLLLWLLLLRLG